jgi:hypothetical protein
MSECPNSDKDFDKIMSRWFDVTSKDYPSNRKKVYYGLCIWVRLILFTSIFYYRKHKYTPYILAVFSLLSIYHYKGNIKNPGKQWWSKRFDLAIAVLLLISTVLVITEKIDPVVMPLILYTSLFGGIITSFFIKFC